MLGGQVEKVSLEMPLVKNCSATECAYNRNQNCHAKAITVGDTITPHCDTFFNSNTHNKETKRIAGVGACKVSGCQYNNDFECTASGIMVGPNQGSVNCLTYRAKAAVA